MGRYSQRKAEDLYKSMTAEGYICWPPACNPSETKVSQNNFGANLTQFTNRKESNGNHMSAMKKNQKYKNGNGKNTKNSNGGNNHCDNKKKSGKGRSNKKTWKTLPPIKEEFDGCIGETPIHTKEVNGRDFQWCQKCGENRKWVTSHKTATHQDDFKQRKMETITSNLVKSTLEKDLYLM